MTTTGSLALLTVRREKAIALVNSLDRVKDAFLLNAIAEICGNYAGPYVKYMLVITGEGGVIQERFSNPASMKLRFTYWQAQLQIISLEEFSSDGGQRKLMNKWERVSPLVWAEVTAFKYQAKGKIGTYSIEIGGGVANLYIKKRGARKHICQSSSIENAKFEAHRYDNYRAV